MIRCTGLMAAIHRSHLTLLFTAMIGVSEQSRAVGCIAGASENMGSSSKKR